MGSLPRWKLSMLRKQNPKVFLSGPMEYAHDGGVDWRLVAEARFKEAGFRVFNPCNISEDVLKPHKLTVASYNKLKKTINTNLHDYQHYVEATKDIVEIDCDELRTSDFVLAKISKLASGGTAGELTLARHFGIPVAAFCDDPLETVSGWVLGLCPHIWPVSWLMNTKPIDHAISFVIKELQK
jgi:nucleoside 2-deoxyribosyltransferase